jgi:hypothetical protein
MYRYTLEAGRRLIDYGLEQQASIIEDYYLVVTAGAPEFRAGRIQNPGTTAERVRLLKSVMADFLFDPARPFG